MMESIGLGRRRDEVGFRGLLFLFLILLGLLGKGLRGAGLLVSEGLDGDLVFARHHGI